jgi:hypothetical protein
VARSKTMIVDVAWPGVSIDVISAPWRLEIVCQRLDVIFHGCASSAWQASMVFC